MTREEAIKILKEPDRIGYNVIHANDEETTRYNIESQMALNMAIKALEQELVLDKIRGDILKCLSALDEIEKFNIYLPNEMSGRRLTYKQCLEFIDKYKADSKEYEEKRKQPRDDTRPYYANEWTPQDSLYVEQGMLYD